MMETLAPCRIRHRASALLQRDGWLESGIADFRGHRCLLMALYDAALELGGDVADFYAAVMEIAAETSAHPAPVGETLRRLMQWQDAPNRLFSEVLRLLEGNHP